MDNENLTETKLAYNIENDAGLVSKLFFLFVSPIFKKDWTRTHKLLARVQWPMRFDIYFNSSNPVYFE